MSDVQYPNRTDLRNKATKVARQAVKGQTYGKAKQQLDAQKAVPMAAPATPTPTRPTVTPGQFGPLNRPSERPNEPITAGASFGPGYTPRNRITLPRAYDPVLTELAALYQAFPTPELADMLDSYIREGY